MGWEKKIDKNGCAYWINPEFNWVEAAALEKKCGVEGGFCEEQEEDIE